MDGAPRPVARQAQPSLQGQQPPQPILDLSDTPAIEAAARAFFLDSPLLVATAACSTQGEPEAKLHTHMADAAAEHAPGSVAVADQRASKYFHLSFTVKHRKSEQISADLTMRIEESVAAYARAHCHESILVRANHDTTLRLELALLFPKERIGESIRRHLKTRTIQNCLQNYTEHWEVASRILGSDADRRHASYEDLRARTLDASRVGVWHMVLDRAPRRDSERLGAASGLAAGGAHAFGPGQVGGVVGGGAASGVLRADAGAAAGSAAGLAAGAYAFGPLQAGGVVGGGAAGGVLRADAGAAAGAAAMLVAGIGPAPGPGPFGGGGGVDGGVAAGGVLRRADAGPAAGSAAVPVAGIGPAPGPGPFGCGGCVVGGGAAGAAAGLAAGGAHAFGPGQTGGGVGGVVEGGVLRADAGAAAGSAAGLAAGA